MELSRPPPWQPVVHADEAERRAEAASLEAIGDPRGRFMAVQLDLARQDPRDEATDYERKREERRLLAEHGKRWLRDLSLLPGEARWERGRVTAVSLDWFRFSADGEEILRRARPRSLRLEGRGPRSLDVLVGSSASRSIRALSLPTLEPSEIAALVASPHLDELRRLRLSVSPEGARRLAESRQLKRLRHLSLLDKPLGPEEIACLLDAPWFAGLRSLAFEGVEHGDEIVRALVAREPPTHLRSLGLGWTSLGTDGATALASWAGLHRLTSLDLEGNRLTDEDVGVLLASRGPRRLRDLFLGANALSGDTIHTLARWPGLAGLRDLRLASLTPPPDRPTALSSLAETASFGRFTKLFHHDLLSVPELARLARWPALSGFTDLTLWGNLPRPRPEGSPGNGGDAAIEAFAQSPFLTGVQRLELGHADVGPDGLAAILSCPSLTSLERLSFRGQPLGDAGAAHLAGWPGLRSLVSLCLEGADVGPDGARALAASPFAAGLRGLSLRQNKLGDDGARALAGSPSLVGLWVLRLDGNAIGNAGAAALAMSSSSSSLRFLGLRGNEIRLRGAARFLTGATHVDLSGNCLGVIAARALERHAQPIALVFGDDDAYFDDLPSNTRHGRFGPAGFAAPPAAR